MESIAWHAAEIFECSAAAAEHRTTPDCLFAWLRADHFVVEPPDPDMRCTAQSVAAHALTVHELALVFEVAAASQELANAIAGITRHQALHLPIPEWSGLITALACPYCYLERGPVFRFTMHHVIEPDDPLAMFPPEWCEVDGSSVVRRDSWAGSPIWHDSFAARMPGRSG